MQMILRFTESGVSYSFSQLNYCLQGILFWTTDWKLKLNAEFLLLVISVQRRKLDGFFSPTFTPSQNFTIATSVRNLGLTFDHNFNFRQYISETCNYCFYHIRDPRRIRRYTRLLHSLKLSPLLLFEEHFIM